MVDRKYSFVHGVPFCRLLLPLIGGILLYSFFPIVWLVFILFLISVSFFCIAFIRDFESRFYHLPFFGLGVFFFFVATGASLTNLKMERVTFSIVGSVSFNGRVVAADISKGGFSRLHVALDGLWYEDCYYSKPLEFMVYIRKGEFSDSIFRGNSYLFRGDFIPSDSLEVRDGFDYGKFLERKGISGIVFGNVADFASENVRNGSVFPFFDRWRAFLADRYAVLELKMEDFALLSSISLGDRSYLSADQKSAFEYSGLSHILAVSGLHVGILYWSLCFFVGITGRVVDHAKLRRLFVLICLWLFAFLSGFSAATVRATFMFSLFVLGGLFDRKASSFNTLMGAATVMLLFNPYYLFDVGFQLSFLALASILYFYPLLNRCIRVRHLFFRYLWDIVCVCVAAQIGIFPLLLHYFGVFPLYFLVGNLLVLPVLPFILIVGWGFLPLSYFDISALCGHVLEFCLGYVNKVTSFLASLPFSVIITGRIPTWLSIVLYVVLLLLVVCIERRKIHIERGC